jgi:hypothetical protein
MISRLAAEPIDAVQPPWRWQYRRSALFHQPILTAKAAHDGPTEQSMDEPLVQLVGLRISMIAYVMRVLHLDGAA